MEIKVLAAVVCIVVCIFIAFRNRNKNTMNKKPCVSETEQIRTSGDTSIDMEEKGVSDSKEEKQRAGNRVYSYINGLTKQMFHYYRIQEWDTFSNYEISQQISQKDIDLVRTMLREREGKLLDDLLACISIEENKVTDRESLKEVFYQMVLPFYPMYSSVFDNEVRYTAFLSRLTLNLFYQLSGKKFKVGYRNKYSNGTVAFIWDKEVYTVYNKSGKVICKASFKENKVYNGFATESLDNDDPDWLLERAGNWKDGVFQSGELNYKYQKHVN